MLRVYFLFCKGHLVASVPALPCSLTRQWPQMKLWMWSNSAEVKMSSQMLVIVILGFPGGSDGKASAHNVGDLGSIPGLGRSPGEGNGNPLQYSSLENPMDRGAWRGYSPCDCKESDTTERLNWTDGFIPLTLSLCEFTAVGVKWPELNFPQNKKEEKKV